MQFRLFKLRFRRQFKYGQKQVEGFGQQAEAGLEQHFFGRFGRLAPVWRFVTAWILLIVLLIGCVIAQIFSLNNHYQSLKPVAGGTYREGVLGSFTNANPLYATSDVDTTMSKLLFTGLLKIDDHNTLVGSLAEKWAVDTKGTQYTVTLKPNLKWQDGSALTADDVLFTYQAIQNPDAQSALAASWQGITVAKKDSRTITFTLPNPLSSFLYSLTNGIIPAKAFAGLPVTEWRSASFNTTKPVGAGPFQLVGLQSVHTTKNNAQILLELRPFDNYVAGKPKLASFIVHVYSDRTELIKDFNDQQVTAIALPSLPPSITAKKGLHQYSFLLSAAAMTFLNTTTGPTADVAVRKALLQATNTKTITASLGYATRSVTEPFLNSQFAYDPAYAQAKYDATAAKAGLEAAGWKLNTNGTRSKSGKTLSINLSASNTSEYARVAHQLQHDWQAVGVEVNLRLQADQEFQDTLNARAYDAALYSISIGNDPDVFVYWDSSQTDPRSTRLNFSNYKSSIADAALEAGRTRLDPQLRKVKYQPFLDAWQKDVPAIGLYQPQYLYVTHTAVYGLQQHLVNSGVDRFNDVQNWMIQTARVTNN